MLDGARKLIEYCLKKNHGFVHNGKLMKKLSMQFLLIYHFFMKFHVKNASLYWASLIQ